MARRLNPLVYFTLTEKITDNSGNITYVSNLYKYFKANTTPSM